MPLVKKTNKDCVDIIETEGLDYAVRHYMSGSSIEDPVTADLWDKAADALHDLVEHLNLDQD